MPGRVEGAPAPTKLRQLRACLRCKLVKTYDQFESQGCDNGCFEANTSLNTLTTPTFHGTMAVMKPGASWVARWHGQSTMACGIYAMKTVGELATAPADRYHDE